MHVKAVGRRLQVPLAKEVIVVCVCGGVMQTLLAAFIKDTSVVCGKDIGSRLCRKR